MSQFLFRVPVKSCSSKDQELNCKMNNDTDDDDDEALLSELFNCES